MQGAGAEAGHLQIQATEENAGCLYCGNENCSESLYSRHRTKAVKAVPCRLTVGGETKFACVDGPDFDGDLVDFDEAMARGTMYRPFEAKAREAACNLFKTQEGK